MTGASSKAWANFSVSMVAEVMISFRSWRRWTSFFRMPSMKIDVQAALVGFVHDQGVVGGERRIALGFRQQDAVGHDLDVSCPGSGCGPESGSCSPPRRPAVAQFIGDALGHRGGGNAPGLGAADQPALTAPGRQTELGQLGGFARTGLTGELARLDRPFLLCRDFWSAPSTRPPRMCSRSGTSSEPSQKPRPGPTRRS
jgi:hypothetical protein